jgi:hypothetical protein
MHSKNLMARTLLIALVLLLPGILLSFALLPVSTTSPAISGSPSSVAETNVHTALHVADMEQAGGVRQDAQNCNGNINLQGTGICPLAIWSGHH